jgi:hypothetical protein
MVCDLTPCVQYVCVSCYVVQYCIGRVAACFYLLLCATYADNVHVRNLLDVMILPGDTTEDHLTDDEVTDNVPQTH